MKSVAEPLGPTRVKLQVEVPFEELRPSLDQAYKRIADQVSIPGFRRGKVPARIIDQRFGRGVVLEEAINDALPDLYSQAVDEAEISPLGSPDVEVTEIEDGQHLKFTVEVDVRPQVDLPEWQGIAISVDDAEVTDEQIDTQLDQLRQRFATLTPVERAAATGDHVVLDLTARDAEGAEMENGRASGLTYEVGSGSMVEGLDEAIVGLSAGEATTFSSTLHGTEEGTGAEIEVTVTAVKEQELPDLDDEFAMMASEFDTLDELKGDLAEQLARMSRLGQALAARDKALEYLLDAVDVPLPQKALESQLDDHFSDGHGDDEHRAEVLASLERSLRAQLILDEVVKVAEVSVSQDELMEYLVHRAQEAGVSPQEYVQQVLSGNGIPAVVADVARGKALALVVEKAVVTDASGNPVDLVRLRDDGTLGDPADDEDEHLGEDDDELEDDGEHGEHDDESPGEPDETGDSVDEAGASR